MMKTVRTPRLHQMDMPPGWGRTGCLVVIPARNEADRIEDCLAALSGQESDVLVVANNCEDATAELALNGRGDGSLAFERHQFRTFS